MNVNYTTYKTLMSQIEERYRKLHREIEAEYSEQITPLLIQYDSDIDILEQTASGENLEELQKKRCDQLFDESREFTEEHDKKLKLLNTKFQTTRRLIQDRFLEVKKTEK